MITRRLLLVVGIGVLGTTLVARRADAVPRKVFAISQQQPAGLAEVPGNPSDSIQFYDVTSVGTMGATNVFNNDPLFSVWLGYEIFEGEAGNEPNGVPRGNREDTSAITFNPANGTIYALAFDSGGPPGQPDDVGDSQGDNDLYRIDYQEILKDFVTNSRPKGTIYAPPTQRILATGPALNISTELNLQAIGSPLFDGTVDGIAHNIPHPASALGLAPPTIFIDNAILKVGEVARTQSPFSFFDAQIDFVDPATLVHLETATRPQSGVDSSPAGDFQIRAIQRVSTSPGLAVIDADGPDNMTGPSGLPAADDDQQGGRNGNTAQSWQSTTMGRLQMDSVDISEPGGWAFVRRDGKLGVWVADNDATNTGDEISYFELDFSGSTPTATKKTLPTSTQGSMSFRLDENPALDGSTNNGEIDFLYIDKNGNLVVGESGFPDSPKVEPRVFTVGIESYNSVAGVTPTGFAASGGSTTFDSTSPWTVSGSVTIPPANDDDADVTNTTKVAYDRSTGYVYIIDQDADFMEDLYVFDPATGNIVYHEVNGINPGLFNTGTQIVFTRGDINGDGVANLADITALNAGIADPTLGGTVTAAVGAEWYDLTGDGLLNAADLAELTSIIGSVPIAGDFEGDGDVDAADLAQWKGDYGLNDDSDADLDGDSDGHDFLIWQRNYTGSLSTAAGAPVPEPVGGLLAALAGLGLATIARRRR